MPAIAQAAIAHAQFETIHPFVDGNGRTGRALIHVILRRRGLAANVLPPVSLVLATWSDGYVNALMDTRYRGRSDSAAARSGLDGWIGLFAAATTRAVYDAELYEASVVELQDSWRARLGRVRAGPAPDRLIDVLPGAPVVTVRSAASLIGRSEQAVNEAIPRLLAAGILRQTTVGRRKSCIRSKRTHRRLHRPRATAGQPNRRHHVLGASACGAAPTAGAVKCAAWTDPRTSIAADLRRPEPTWLHDPMLCRKRGTKISKCNLSYADVVWSARRRSEGHWRSRASLATARPSAW